MKYPNSTFSILEGPDIHSLKGILQANGRKTLDLITYLYPNRGKVLKVNLYDVFEFDENVIAFMGKAKFDDQIFGLLGAYQTYLPHGLICIGSLAELPDEMSEFTIENLLLQLDPAMRWYEYVPVPEILRSMYAWR